MGAVRDGDGWAAWAACECVYRRVFRECLGCYHHCQASLGAVGSVTVERVGRARGRCAIIASFKRAEYAADFVLTARRALRERPVELVVFHAHHIDTLSWRDSIPRVRVAARGSLTKAMFFRLVYGAEELIGAEILSASPHRLFPTRDYFYGFTLPASAITSPHRKPRAH
jgi:hypothetical protein